MHSYITDRTIPAIFGKIKQGSTLLSIKEYKNNFSEIADFRIVFHFSYDNAVQKALNMWKAMKPKNKLEEFVLRDLITSYTESLLYGFNPRALSAHAYCHVKDYDGKVIRGVKYHMNNKELHLVGLRVNKTIVKPAEYPAVKESPAAILRKELISCTPLANYRQFKLINGRFKTISVDNITLTEQDLLKRCPNLI